MGLALAWIAPAAVYGAGALVQSGPDRFDGTTVSSTPGEDLEIHFNNPDLKNKTVTILLFDDDNHETTVQISLDNDGKGKATVPTPNWEVVVLAHPTSNPHGVVVFK